LYWFDPITLYGNDIDFQLCVAICNILLEALCDDKVQESQELFSQELSETSIKHFSLFLTRSVLVGIDSNNSTGKDQQDLVKATRDSLKRLVDCGDDVGAGLATLWKVFMKSFEKIFQGI